MKKAIILLAIAVLLISMVSGAIQPKLKEVREKHEPELFAIEGVSGVSADEATNEIVVYVEKPEIKNKVPKVLDGFPVRFEVTGRIHAHQATIATEMPMATYKVQSTTTYSRTGYNRPVFGGISIGPPQTTIYITAGTLGLVTLNNSGIPVVLSNAHVIAMDTNAKFLPIGTPTLQPGTYDGGTNNDYYQIGALSNYIPIRFNNFFVNNYADAAISTLTVDGKQGFILNETNDGFYTIKGTTEVAKGQIVRKSGRTTAVTENKVTDTQASVRVYYGVSGGKWAIFKDQILVAQPFDAAGDSGSAVDDTNGNFVGLVFAGSSTTAVVNKAKYILSPLGISI